jgi:predicted transcriptional regulator
MSANLSKELVAALHASGAGELEVIDPATARVYLIVDGALHREALDALRRERDRDAIAQGLAELERGLGISTEEARRQTKQRLTDRRR